MTVSIKTLASLACVALLAGCATFYEIPIETPLTRPFVRIENLL